MLDERGMVAVHPRYNVRMPATKTRKTAPKSGPGNLTDEHKEALAVGRKESRIVRQYLDAMERHQPRRGRRRTAESVERQLEVVEQRLAEASPYDRIQLLQQRRDLQKELEQLRADDNLPEAEAAFIEVARSYSERRHIAYATWREFGVPASVLKAAGLKATRGA